MTEDEAKRRLAAEMIISKHGYLPLGFLPDVTVEQLEKFAADLATEDAKLTGVS